MSTLGEHKEILLEKAKRALVEWDRFGGDDYDDVALAMDDLRQEIKFIEERE